MAAVRWSSDSPLAAWETDRRGLATYGYRWSTYHTCGHYSESTFVIYLSYISTIWYLVSVTAIIVEKQIDWYIHRSHEWIAYNMHKIYVHEIWYSSTFDLFIFDCTSGFRKIKLCCARNRIPTLFFWHNTLFAPAMSIVQESSFEGQDLLKVHSAQGFCIWHILTHFSKVCSKIGRRPPKIGANCNIVNPPKQLIFIMSFSVWTEILVQFFKQNFSQFLGIYVWFWHSQKIMKRLSAGQ